MVVLCRHPAAPPPVASPPACCPVDLLHTQLLHCTPSPGSLIRYQTCVHVDDIQPLYDVSGVQAYCINSRRAVLIHPKVRWGSKRGCK